MKHIQEWLGHSSYTLTADTYSHLNYESKLESANVISKELEYNPQEPKILPTENANVKSDINEYYDSLSNDEINTILGNNCLTIDEEKYVIAYKEYDYFDYFIYTSSIGGEVMITTIVDGDEVIKKSSKLTDDEKASLLARTISEPSTLDSLNLYVEMLEYNSYQEFLTVKSQYETVSGYVSLGLECRILFYLKVEQVD